MSPCKLGNYTMIKQGQTNHRYSNKGGPIIYLHNKCKGNIELVCNKYTSWEGHFIKIANGGLKIPIILGNIQRPQTDLVDKYKEFIQELEPILNSIEKQKTECLVSAVNF